MHSRAATAAIAFNCTTLDPMKTTLLLTDEAETVRLMLREVTSGGVAVRESQVRAGYNCDRWGHPSEGRFARTKPNENRRSDFITNQTLK
jgi:hypothetical protein